MAIKSVKAKHIASGRTHFFNLGTWNHHQAIRRKSGVRVYKLIQMIHETAGNKNLQKRSLGEVETVYTQPQSRGLSDSPTSPPPPPKKRKKKGCNC